MMIKLLIMLILIIMIYYFITLCDGKMRCDFDNLNIDDIVIIQRPEEYQKLINNMLDEKKYLFSDEELKVLKNKNQIYKVIKDGDKTKIINISYPLKTCVDTKEQFTTSDENINEDILYNNISSDMKDKIKQFDFSCNNFNVLKNDKYLKNYYYDMYGNRIDSSLIDYFVDYYTSINIDDPVECLPVKTIVGSSDFIIPDQFNVQQYFTNAYNIDYERVINPLTYW